MKTAHLTWLLAGLFVLTGSASADDQPLITSISKETLFRNRDGQSLTWFHPRACMMPNPDGEPVTLMGNFNVTNISPNESWVTVGEWMPRHDYCGDVLLARIRWEQPNRLPLW